MSYIFHQAKEDMLSGDGSFTIGTLYVVLVGNVGTASTANATNPTFANLSDIASSGGTRAAVALDTPTFDKGVLNVAGPTTFTSIDGSDGNTGNDPNFTSLVIYNDTVMNALATTNKLIAVINNFGNITKTGGNIVVNWDTTSTLNDNSMSGGIFAL